MTARAVLVRVVGVLHQPHIGTRRWKIMLECGRAKLVFSGGRPKSKASRCDVCGIEIARIRAGGGA